MDYDFLYPQGGGEKQSNNKAIDNILRSGADFIGNQFQAMFYWFDEQGRIENVFYQHFNTNLSSTLVYNKDSEKFDSKNPTLNSVDGDLDYDNKYKQAILSKEGFLVRFLNIKMPTIKQETYTIKVGMQTIEKVRTISKSDLIITGGSNTPLEGEMAYDYDEIKAACDERLARLEALKEKAQASQSAKAPAANGFGNLGF